MKKHFLLFVLMLLPLAASAFTGEVVIGGINYYIVTKAQIAEVRAKSPKYSGNIVIPPTVEYEGVTYNVTGIGNSAFQYCTRLISITIPNSISSIGYEAFSGCSGLTSITVESGNTVYDSRDNCNAIIKTVSNTLIAGCVNTVIPNSVTKIGDYAFYGCSGLTSVTIPNSVTSIGNQAFSGCSSLISATIGSGVTAIGSDAFYGCGGLTSVIIPNRVTYIGSSAFSDCSSLTSITIGYSVKNIGYYAFRNCPELIEVCCYAENVPSTYSIFQDSYIEYATLYVPMASIEVYKSTAPWNGFKNILAVSGEVEIGGINYYIETKPQIAEVIEMRPKYSGDIVIPSTVEYEGVTYNVTSIGDYAFNRCSGLTSVTIPNSVTSIKSLAFSDCSSLTSVTIPNSVTYIDGAAFDGCSGLTSITIGNSVISIYSCAFYGCSGLTSVTIPNSVTYIGGYAFEKCSGLTSVTIGSGVQTIGNGAFANCQALEDVNCHAENVPKTSANAFTNSTIENATLHVPAVSIEAYESMDPWSGFKTIVAISSKGDVNGDGQVGIGDLIAVSNFMGGEGNVALEQADVNGDGEVGIGDIITITNIMAGE